MNPARPEKPITIVGGGLAGLTLGIGLRQQGVPVTIFEAGHYPRHRVCGEFISGRGQQTIERLGLRDSLMSAGTIPARTTAFFSPHGAAPVRELTEPAWSISRHTLDALLAAEFRRLGGDLHENHRWRNPEFPAGVVRATGRRMQPAVAGWRWFGLKVHARDVALTADLEMHLSPSGYLGICRLADGEFNICGLFRRAATSSADTAEPPVHWRDTLRGAPGSHWHARLKNATFDDASFCSVAGLSLKPQRAAASSECCLGDTITMIAPMTGNGMSMAFESAGLAIDPLSGYSRGELSWHDTQRTIAQRCDSAFSRRLGWAALLQSLIFLPGAQNILAVHAPRWKWLWRLLLSRTR